MARLLSRICELDAYKYLTQNMSTRPTKDICASLDELQLLIEGLEADGAELTEEEEEEKEELIRSIDTLRNFLSCDEITENW